MSGFLCQCGCHSFIIVECVIFVAVFIFSSRVALPAGSVLCSHACSCALHKWIISCRFFVLASGFADLGQADVSVCIDQVVGSEGTHVRLT